MKKHVVLLTILVVTFITFIFFYYRPHNYELEYKVDNFVIKEIYNKNDAYYTFYITYNDTIFEVISLNKYTTHRKLIQKINVIENDEETCLEFKESETPLYPICTKETEYYSFYINNLSTFKAKNNYENIQIADLNNRTYLLWNYQDFIYLNNKKSTKISLFSKDIYSLNLVYQSQDYLFIPDYSQDYIFDKLYSIDAKSGKIKSIKLRYSVYFDSYFMGMDKNKLYLYDFKNEQEYYIDIKKAEIYKTSNKVLIDNSWQKVSNQTIKSEKPTFNTQNSIDYYLDSNKLYMAFKNSNIKLLISNRNISKIVKASEFDVYYISEDTLYYFNPYDGEKALLQYSEWQFNHQNMIFIF